jgi:hypothetical protein
MVTDTVNNFGSYSLCLKFNSINSMMMSYLFNGIIEVIFQLFQHFIKSLARFLVAYFLDYFYD